MLLLGLFAFAVINAGLILPILNDANQSIGDDPSLTYYSNELNKSLYNSQTVANTTETAVGTSPVTLTSGFPVFDAVFGIWKTIKVIPIQIWNLTKGLVFEKMFGGNEYAVIFTVIGAILLLTFMFAVWKWVSTGESG
jgi:hypothetical protein